MFCNFPRIPVHSQTISYYPRTTALPGCNVISGLGSFPFARHYLGNHFCFLFLGVLRCFSSPGFISYTYVFSAEFYGFTIDGFPIRSSPDQRIYAPTRGLSQLITTFIIFQCQGIHRMPLFAWPYYLIYLLSQIYIIYNTLDLFINFSTDYSMKLLNHLDTYTFNIFSV